MSPVDRLPRRLPVGTRYVVEGVPNDDGDLTIVSRMVVLPNGTVVRLPLATARMSARPARRRRPASITGKRIDRKRKPRRV